MFEHQGAPYGHVLDPRCGCPTQNALPAAVVLPNGTTADAWSTALLVSAEAWMPRMAKRKETPARCSCARMMTVTAWPVLDLK